jgi:hypothetical protein
MKKILRYLGFIVLALVIFGLAGFLIWASNPAEPQPEARLSLSDTPEIKFTIIDDWLVFEPTDSVPTTGLIFYPGGRVDPRAYAPHARAIAAEGFTVVVVPMPLNFAFLGINRATQVIEAFPGIKHWAVGGHSLGGAMAAEFVKDHPQEIDGLALWASYPAENTDLSALEIQAMSIYATNDGLATAEEVLSARPRLPAGTRFVEIPGGNHAGFGWYGPQGGDGELEITKLTQQSQIVESMVFFLYGLRKE